MTTHVLPQPVFSTEDVKLARNSGRLLSQLVHSDSGTQQIRITDDEGASHPVEVPVTVLRFFVDVLNVIGAGHSIGITPLHYEMTTQEAANLLNVSRPYLVQLLERGEIPFHKVGKHRRVRSEDVIAYKDHIDAKRNKVLDELAEQAQSLNMGYE